MPDNNVHFSDRKSALTSLPGQAKAIAGAPFTNMG